MKSLLEIQQDVRNLESHMKEMAQELTKEIQGLEAEIAHIREDGKKVETDFVGIESLAAGLPFGTHPLKRLPSENAAKRYLEMLLLMVQVAKDTPLQRLIFIQWLKTQTNLTWTLEELLTDSCRIKGEDFAEFLEIVPEDYHEIFMLDALIAANMEGEAEADVLSYLAEWSALLKIDRYKLKTLALTAKMVLYQNLAVGGAAGLVNEGLDFAKNYQFYLSEGMSRAIKNISFKTGEAFGIRDSEERRVVFAIPQSVIGDMTFVSTGKNYEKVRAGEFLGRIIDNAGKELEHICAPISGKFFYFFFKNVQYGIVSMDFIDGVISLKKWLKDQMEY